MSCKTPYLESRHLVPHHSKLKAGLYYHWPLTVPFWLVDPLWLATADFESAIGDPEETQSFRGSLFENDPRYHNSSTLNLNIGNIAIYATL
jgi:hypothetical protein